MADSTAGQGTSTLAKVLAIISAIGPPIAVATALLVYFGWARSDAEARAMGLDVSLFGYSVQDYVLRSIRSLFLPLVLLVILGIAWFAADSWLTARTGSGPDRRFIQRTASTATFVGIVVAGTSLLISMSLPDQALIFLPFLMAAGVLVAAWGVRLRRVAAAGWTKAAAGWTTAAAASPGAAASEPSAAGPPGEPVATTPPRPAVPPHGRPEPVHRQVRKHALESTLVFALVTLLLFWGTADFAQSVGRGRAAQIEQSVDSMPRATLYSTARLAIGAPNVREQAVGTQAAPLYQYRGLRLLVASGGRFFFLHNGWTLRTGTVVVLPDDGKVRVELGN